MFIKEQIKMMTFIMVSERNFKQNTWNTLTFASHYLPVCTIQLLFKKPIK